MSELAFTKDDLREYLKVPNCFLRNSERSCPIAWFLYETKRMHNPRVGLTVVCEEYGDEEYELPAWATTFIDIIDEKARGPITNQECLTILDGI